MSEKAADDVLVIGGGQAGLSVAHELMSVGLEPIVLERDRVGASWARLWESFCLNTPNWSVQLPGMPYEGHEPDRFLTRDEIVAHLRRYRSTIDVDVREGVEVRRLRPGDDGLHLETSVGAMRARAVVVCTGAYQTAYRPPGAAAIPDDVPVLTATSYRHPDDTADGAILIVGAGQSGCQIAEDLLDAGREVVLSVGKAGWAPRRIGGHDIVWWVLESGFLDQTLDDLPSPAARLAANVTASGVDGGHDLHPRLLRDKGATLVGRFAGYDDGAFRFDDDLAASIAWSDERLGDLAEEVATVCARRGMAVPDLPEPPPFDPSAPTSIDPVAIGAVIFTGGFRPDYGWVEAPGAFDDLGFPVHRDGASAVAPGLFFAGVHFLRRRRSSLLCGIADDAVVVAGGVRDHLASQGMR